MPQAFDVYAYYYLVKPINNDKLIKVLNDAVKECNKQEDIDQKSLLLKYKGISTKLFFKDIIYIECYNKKIKYEITFGIPIGSPLDSLDISVILNNAIDNAIKAAEIVCLLLQQRMIHKYTGRVKKYTKNCK